MSVPFIDLRRFEPDFLERWAKKAAEVSANTQFLAGPEITRLEEDLRDESGVAGVVGCANGTDALQIALRAAGAGPDDVVLLPDATFWATFEAVINVGARPVTVDISLDDLQMDFDLFREAVLKYRPRAAFLVHLYGWGSARLDDFRQFADEHGVALVEDGAQSYGVLWKGKSIYRDTHFSTVSFYPAKVLGACGDAGAVYCSSEEQARVARQFGNHGRTTHYEHGLVGWNSRLGGLEAAWLNLAREYFPQRLESRQRAAALYRDRLDALGVRTVGPPDGYTENGYLNVTLHDPDRRPAIESVLREHGIGFGKVYPGSMSQQPGAAGLLVGRVGGANAEYLSSAVLNLPLFAYIRDEEIDEVLAVLEKALEVAGIKG